MKVMSQVVMVMNLDKCIGCHTCSVTCKQAWTNRTGTEYMWFNNVETRPGLGYPRTWEDQEKWKGGWRRTASGKLVPRSGGKLAQLAKIFANPNMPQIDDYYEPWTYDYDKLLSAPAGSKALPVAQARSQMSGKPLKNIEWGPNWDDNLAGSTETMQDDPTLKKMNQQVKADLENSFMLTRTLVVVGGCVFRVVPIRRFTSTIRAAKPKNAPSATPGLRPVTPRFALKPV